MTYSENSFCSMAGISDREAQAPSASLGHSRCTRMVFMPAACPPLMSAFGLSPIITAVCGKPAASRAIRNSSGCVFFFSHQTGNGHAVQIRRKAELFTMAGKLRIIIGEQVVFQPCFRHSSSTERVVRIQVIKMRCQDVLPNGAGNANGGFFRQTERTGDTVKVLFP